MRKVRREGVKSGEVFDADEEEYRKKCDHLRILKSVQAYLKDEGLGHAAVYPINVPEDLLLQVLDHHGSKPVDDLIHEIFRIGLRIWAENLFMDAFGSTKDLEAFIEEVKRRNRGSMSIRHHD